MKFSSLEDFITYLSNQDKYEEYTAGDILETLQSIPGEYCMFCEHMPFYGYDRRGYVTPEPENYIFPDDICPFQCDDVYYNKMPSYDFHCAYFQRRKK